MGVLELVDNFLYTTYRRESVVVETFGNSDSIISNMVIIGTFSTATRCKYAKALISETQTSYGILLVIFITFSKI